MNKPTHNDTERRQWIDNDEGLYNDQRRSRMTMRKYIETHRAEIDAVIDAEARAFTFEGEIIGTAFAKYMLEYLATKFPSTKE